MVAEEQMEPMLDAVASDPSGALVDERHRVTVLRRYDVLDLEPDESYADLLRLSAAVTDSPVAVVSLVDEDRVWHLATLGATPQQMQRGQTLADEVLRRDGPVEVAVGTDGEAWLDDPLVGGVGAKTAYAVPVHGQGVVLGCLVVADDRPAHRLSEVQRGALAVVSDRVGAELELNRVRVELALELGAKELQRRTDDLTGLPLRRPVFERSAIEFSRHRRHLAPLVVGVIDLDDLDGFRSRHGASATDLLLQRIAAAVDDVGRLGDMVGRWGDGRLVALICDTPMGGAEVVAERMRLAVAGAHVDGLTLSASIGLAEAGPDLPTFADALRVAAGLAEAVAVDGGNGVGTDADVVDDED